MGQELGLFFQQKNIHAQKLQEISDNFTNPEELAKKQAEEMERFKGQVRKFLPAALSAIKMIFETEYSLYKVGKDFSSEFNVIETNIKKTRPEIIDELEEFMQQASTMGLPEDQLNYLYVAVDVIATYTDDAPEYDEHKNDFIHNAKVTASSIITKPTRENNAFIPVKPEADPNSFNPYANQPIDVDAQSGFSSPEYNRKTINDPFASLYNGAAPVVPIPTPDLQPQDMERPGGITAEFQNNSIFGSGTVNETSTVDQSLPVVEPTMQAPQNQDIAYNKPTMVVPMVMPMINDMQPTPPPSVQPSNQQSLVPILQPSNQPPPMINQPYIQPLSQPEQPSGPVEMEYVSNNKFVQNEGIYRPKLREENKDISPAGNLGPEKSTLLMKLLTGIIMYPIFTIIITAIVVFSLDLLIDKTDLIDKLMEALPSVNHFNGILMLVIMFLSIPCGEIVIKLAKKRTKHIGKFLILPAVIFAPMVLLGRDILDKLEISPDIAVYYPEWVQVALIFSMYMFIRAFFAVDETYGTDSPIKWNGAEKISMFGVLYIYFIPVIYMTLISLEIDKFGDIYETMYLYENMEYITSGACAFLILVMLALNIKEDYRR